MIAGTSIGALVGGCYLAGKLDDLERFARSLSRRRMLGLLDIQFAGSGLFGGMRLNRAMETHMRDIQIEDLPKPFVAVATEIATGHEIWLTHGDLVAAMRASYSLPGIFEPVDCNGKVLVDGALVNPVPVSVCRARTAPGRGGQPELRHFRPLGRRQAWRAARRDECKSGTESAARSQNHAGQPVRLGISGVMVESYNIIQDRISRARLAGDPPDYALHPRLSDIGSRRFPPRLGSDRPRLRSRDGTLAGSQAAGRTGLGRSDIGADIIRLALDFLDPPLDDIADGDHADQLAVTLDRQVTKAPFRHQFHQFRNTSTPRCRCALSGRHQFGNGFVKSRRHYGQGRERYRVRTGYP
jgi:NTE family protein